MLKYNIIRFCVWQEKIANFLGFFTVLLLSTAMRMKAEALPWKVILKLDYIYNRMIPATVSASSYEKQFREAASKGFSVLQIAKNSGFPLLISTVTSFFLHQLHTGTCTDTICSGFHHFLHILIAAYSSGCFHQTTPLHGILHQLDILRCGSAC